jgi:hypothetical protein
MWESAGRRVSATLDGLSAVAVLGDDPIATAAVALGLSRMQAMRRRVFLADLLGEAGALSALIPSDDLHGVSDMMRFGVSLGHVAHPVAGTPNLYIIAGGSESPLADDVLADRRWATLVDQLHLTDSILLIAAPSIAPSIQTLVAQLDGILLVGDATPPTAETRILGEVRAASAMRTPLVAARAIAGPLKSSSMWRSWIWVVPLLVLIVAAVVSFPRWRERVGLGTAPAAVPLLSDSVTPVAPPTAVVPRSDAAYGVELPPFTNSERDALDRLARYADSLPAATFSTTQTGSDSVRWYRIVSGAFPDSASAGAFLASLRDRGVVSTGAGSVTRTPFALLLDSASSDALSNLRVSAYRGRGIPAYALRDSLGVWRVYAGAFSAEVDAAFLKRQLDSLNIQSILVIRVGSSS